ncbi:hypothetical protein CHUAL_010210 [Chamberlinius hualienensis]
MLSAIKPAAKTSAASVTPPLVQCDGCTENGARKFRHDFSIPPHNNPVTAIFLVVQYNKEKDRSVGSIKALNRLRLKEKHRLCLHKPIQTQMGTPPLTLTSLADDSSLILARTLAKQNKKKIRAHLSGSFLNLKYSIKAVINKK